MAAKKLKKSDFKALQKKRSPNSLKLQEKILIVCEGEKTEPNYFMSINRFLPPGVVEIDIYGEGENTLSLVDTAISHKKRVNRKAKSCPLTRPYDQCWVVFDRDSFKADAFDNAIYKAEANDFNVAYSNEAFELWYLLLYVVKVIRTRSLKK